MLAMRDFDQRRPVAEEGVGNRAPSPDRQNCTRCPAATTGGSLAGPLNFADIRDQAIALPAHGSDFNSRRVVEHASNEREMLY